MKSYNIVFYGSKTYQDLVQNHLKEGMQLMVPNKNGLEFFQNQPNKSRTVVILLLNQEGKKKWEFFKSKFPNLPIIVLAKNPNRVDLLCVIRSGMKNFLVLPLQDGELSKAIIKASSVSHRLFLKNQFHWKKWFNNLKSFFTGKESPTSFLFSPIQHSPEILGFNALPWNVSQPQITEEKLYSLHVKFFGSLEVTLFEKKVPKITSQKNNALLAYLLYNHEKPINREILMSKFWEYNSPSSARNSLNVAICALRKHFEKYSMKQEFIILENNCYSINPAFDIWTDVDQFRQMWQKGRATELSQGLESALVIYHKALGHYTDDLLENMRFEEWCEPERDNLTETYLFILNRLSLHFYTRKEYDACLNICKRMLLKDPCMEDVHRMLMECYNNIGLRDMARKQYFKCLKILKEEFDIEEPSKQTQILYKKLASG